MNARKPEPAQDGKTPAEREHVEELLDESLEDTFPASDPPAMTEPKRAPRPHDAD